jgi:hypothetical protein
MLRVVATVMLGALALIAARGILLFEASTDGTDAKRQTWQDAARKVREKTMI